MKTNEEKLKQLLQVAQINGWKTNIAKLYLWLRFCDNKEYEPVIKDNYLFSKGDHDYSLNDLVTNFEEGKISFIKALCNASQDWQIPQGEGHLFAIGERSKQDHSLNDWTSTYRVVDIKEWLLIQWTLQPTSQRLEWLFETFEHLL